MTEQVVIKEKGDKEITVEGVLDLEPNGSGRLLDPKFLGKPRPADPFIPRELVRRFKLKAGRYIVGKAYQNDRYKNPKVHYIVSADGLSLEDRRKKMLFTSL